MAKAVLPVNFQDDILTNELTRRKYRMINNTDGTVSFEDVSTYDQVGSNFGSAQVNATNEAVNASADASKIIDDLDLISAVTANGYISGALAVKALNNKFAGCWISFTDEEGNPTDKPYFHWMAEEE